MKIEISNGELLDKLSILEIKLAEIVDEEKLNHIRKEYRLLVELARPLIELASEEYNQLKKVNRQLWDIENKIRIFEKSKEFNAEFIETARSVYRFNDERARIKKKINIVSESDLSEEKSYESY